MAERLNRNGEVRSDSDALVSQLGPILVYGVLHLLPVIHPHKLDHDGFRLTGGVFVRALTG